MQQPSWMAEAWRELGQSEIRGPAHNPRIVAMFDELGHHGHGDETAWCAAFVGACLERAGIASTRSLRARSYLGWGGPADPPSVGAIAVLQRGSDPALGHVGFLVGMTGTHVVILGGNQANAVNVSAFDQSLVLGFRQPASSPATDTRGDKFDLALRHVLAMEGGWTDDPHDPGGPTNKGITLAVYARERGIDVTSQTLTELKAALRAIPDDLVRSIYESRYWQPSRCPALRPSLALMHFDASVNHGVGTAARFLQEALGVEIDGEIGPITLGAARTAEPRMALTRYAAIRRQRYRALPHFWRFGRGWLRRVDATLAAATHLVPPSSDPAQTEETPFMTGPTDAPTTKPYAPTETKSWWQSMTIWGTVLTAITTVLPLVGVVLGISITPELAEEIGQNIILVIQAAGGLIGTLMALFGRTRATALLQVRSSRTSL
ncbi:TIGR02594 family protein [Hyphomicrobium sp. CS1BSMeth3]|uniref:TIGR02594 family protein n=1 Tax=Hyphomicrobium sp. CS1BSMeth3 TaxID=1892844 RepID=UPI0009315CAF|nr:TIGR02594 family protein [Hyphomicrobium sp. CS1BSMeth3]